MSLNNVEVGIAVLGTDADMLIFQSINCRYFRLKDIPKMYHQRCRVLFHGFYQYFKYPIAL